MEINLFDLPADRIYLKFKKSFIQKINHIMKSRFGNLYKLKCLFEVKAGKDIWPYRWFSGDGYFPLWIVKYFPEIFDLDEKVLEKNVISIKGPKHALALNRIRFPIYFSEELARIVSHLSADGYVTNGKVTYSNKNKDLINQFKRDCHRVFGNFDSRMYYYKKKCYELQLPSVIGDILSVFNISFFHDKIEIPQVILNSEKNIKRHVLSAFFDDEGSVGTKTIRLEITGKKAIKQIVSLLKEFDISINKISTRKRNKKHSRTYYFTISGREDLISFHKNIGFSHKTKQKDLVEEINSYKVFQRKKHRAKKEILQLLSSGEKTTSELLDNLNIKNSCLSHHLKPLIKESKVQPIRRLERDEKGRIVKTYENIWKIKK